MPITKSPNDPRRRELQREGVALVAPYKPPAQCCATCAHYEVYATPLGALGILGKCALQRATAALAVACPPMRDSVADWQSLAWPEHRPDDNLVAGWFYVCDAYVSCQPVYKLAP